MKKLLSRRDVLKLMALGAGGACLGACRAPAAPTEASQVTQPPAADQPTPKPTARPAPASEVVIVTTGWPIGLMPDPDAVAADPTAKVYAEVLQAWLDQHPGVTLEGSNVNIWSGHDVATAIAGGTAPMYMSGGAIGSWSYQGQLAAFAQGLAADVTALVAKYEVEKKVIAPAITRWKFFSIGGKHFGFPQEFNVGNGIYYRLDLLKAAGFDAPKPDWKWSDFRAMAKAISTDAVHGGVAQVWGQAFSIQSFAGGDDGVPFMELPSPETPWHYTYMHHAQPVVDACTFYRAMVMEDKTILTDATFTDAEVNAVFNRGEAGFMFNNAGFYVLPGDQGIAPLEALLGQDRGEVVGWVSHPHGDNGGPSGTQSFVHIMTLDPNASEEARELAYNLYDYLTFGEGFTMMAQGIWEATHDLRLIFTAYPMINGVTKIEGVPGTIKDAWPAHYLAAVDAAAELPQFPGKGLYLPPEENPGPPDSAYQDALSRISFDPEAGDIAGILKQASEMRNQQAATYTSSIPADTFKTGIARYYEDYGAALKTAASDYYANIWKPFFEEFIAPKIS